MTEALRSRDKIVLWICILRRDTWYEEIEISSWRLLPLFSTSSYDKTSDADGIRCMLGTYATEIVSDDE